MAAQSMELAYQVFQGTPPAEDTVLIDPELITADNIADYTGWTDPR